MKVPVSLLREFVAVPVEVPELVQRLTLGGFEVEEVLEVEGEKVLEINVTPNRGDCLSILGIAREVSALFGATLFPPKKPKIHPREKSGKISVTIKAAKPCPRYMVAFISGVRVAPSPSWLVRRLQQFGMRSVNNIVDVTNYVMMELGQPLHAFDAHKLRGNKIVIRMASNDEKLLTLDGEEQELKTKDLVIADAEGPVALAGIMGGKDSEIDQQTTDMALECAFFDPSVIRKTSRRLGLQTDSSYRFERRVDPELLPALDRAVSLIQEVAGGRVESVVDKDRSSRRSQKIIFLPNSIASYLGGFWNASEMKRVFKRLSFQVRDLGKRGWEVTPPSYRGDIFESVDLIEEIARVEGLEKIPVTFPSLATPPLRVDGSAVVVATLERQVRRLLVRLGVHEVIHLSFFSPDDVKKLDPSLLEKGVFLDNPLSQEYAMMRPTLIPSLLNTVAYHHRHKIFSVQLFELRNCFQKDNDRIQETKTLSGVLTGQRLLSHWSDFKKGQETDFYDIKGILEMMFNDLRLKDISFSPESVPVTFLHPGKQALIFIGGEPVGRMGEIHPDLQNQFDLKKAAFVFELNWDILSTLSLKKGTKRYFRGYSNYPRVERDIALVVQEGITAGSILEFIKRQDASIQEVSVFDLYRGEPVPAGKKSIAFSIQMGHRDRTMTDEEVNQICARIVESLKGSFEVEIR